MKTIHYDNIDSAKFIRILIDTVRKYELIADDSYIEAEDDFENLQQPVVTPIHEFIKFPCMLISGDEKAYQTELMQNLIRFVFQEYDNPKVIIITQSNYQDYREFELKSMIVTSVEDALDVLDGLGTPENEAHTYVFIDGYIDLFFEDCERTNNSFNRIIKRLKNTHLYISTMDSDPLTVTQNIIDMFHIKVLFKTMDTETSNWIINNPSGIGLNSPGSFILDMGGMTSIYRGINESNCNL